ncbi:MAG: ATP-binding protein [bacterium]
MEEAAAAVVPRVASGAGSWFERLRAWLPQGRGLPQAEWHVRHRAIVFIIFGHAIGLAIFGLTQGWPASYALGETAVIAALGGIAAMRALSRSMRAGVAALALVVSSAVLTQFWHGVIEGHFHFFVIVALISLYQDWVPFLLAILFVALDHGLVGTLLPQWVYNHQDALDHPWKWAAIHATLVLSECVALIVVWRANEKSREETDRILRSAGEGIVGIDAECRITFMNPAARKMMGDGTGDRHSGKPLYEIVLGEDNCPLFDGPGILRRTAGPIQAEGYLSRSDGTKMAVELLCTPIEGRAHAEGAVVAFRDITERKAALLDRALAQHQERELQRLQEVNTFKTQFMNMAAHELNTPLTPIKVQLHMLKTSADSPPMDAHRNAIQMLDRNFRRLSELVGEILDSSRLQGNRLAVRPETIDLAPAVRQVAESFAPLAREAKVKLECDLPATLPCVADPLRVSQALYNLLSNAVKFTPSGGRIGVRARADGGDVVVTVTDSGIGLSEQQIARLFQPFSQVHESQLASNPGSGLGLYISRGIAQLHGGDLGVQSAGPGKGSSFTMRLPARGKGDAQIADPFAPRQSAAGA